MARIHRVMKAQKAQGPCPKCGKEILPGMPYKWAKIRPSGPRSSLKLKRCGTCPDWRPSEMTYSKMSGVYAAQEGFGDAVGGWSAEDGIDVINEALSQAAEEIRAVAEEYRESASNAGGLGADWEEKADQLESWADEVEQAAEQAGDQPEELPFPDDASEAETEEHATEMEEWQQQVIDVTQDVINECPV